MVSSDKVVNRSYSYRLEVFPAPALVLSSAIRSAENKLGFDPAKVIPSASFNFFVEPYLSILGYFTAFLFVSPCRPIYSLL